MRIKITGYLETDDLDSDQLDLSDSTGLSAEGYDNLITGEDGAPLQITGLNDVEVELVAGD